MRSNNSYNLMNLFIIETIRNSHFKPTRAESTIFYVRPMRPILLPRSLRRLGDDRGGETGGAANQVSALYRLMGRDWAAAIKSIA